MNAELARNVAAAVSPGGTSAWCISTDHLFAGTRSGYREDDAPEPLNEYARSKLLAEEWVQQAHPQPLILRTNFFGWGHAYRQSFSDWVIQALRAGQPVTMFDDVAPRRSSPTHWRGPRTASSRCHAGGTFNVPGDERVSEIRICGALGAHFQL
ncbi:MAG: sugar nucleotide-binding protein [Verrucomicrobia bacterium]|nr:sugar nucleotide-binding protein [Verrucomicrobiota bacterium]